MEKNAKYHSGSLLAKIAFTVVWGLGYFFGFSLVSIFSFGLCHAEEFSVLIHGRNDGHHYPIFKQFGKLYLEAQCVSLLGWMLIGSLIYLVIL